MTAYFEKDEFGEYLIPEEEQRPVFLMGPPGIGKTAIMKQIAQELGGGRGGKSRRLFGGSKTPPTECETWPAPGEQT